MIHSFHPSIYKLIQSLQLSNLVSDSSISFLNQLLNIILHKIITVCSDISKKNVSIQDVNNTILLLFPSVYNEQYTLMNNIITFASTSKSTLFYRTFVQEHEHDKMIQSFRHIGNTCKNEEIEKQMRAKSNEWVRYKKWNRKVFQYIGRCIEYIAYEIIHISDIELSFYDVHVLQPFHIRNALQRDTEMLKLLKIFNVVIFSKSCHIPKESFQHLFHDIVNDPNVKIKQKTLDLIQSFIENKIQYIINQIPGKISGNKITQIYANYM